MSGKLGVGFIGAGFITNFHIRAWQGVREADIAGIVSLTVDESQAAADNCRKYRVGDPRVYKSISEMVADPEIDALWICAPNLNGSIAKRYCSALSARPVPEIPPSVAAA